jgi:peptidoglycan L-alanyl-D-glutamate endopeptidase CwlK
MVLGVLLYFVLVTLALALLMLSPVRAWVSHRLAGGVAGSRAAVRQAASSGHLGLSRVAGYVHGAGTCAWRWLSRHLAWVAITLMLLLGLPLAAFLVRAAHHFDGFDHTASHAVDPHIESLLAGEQLVPPPALPPEMFMTREVELRRPFIAHASRQWELLDDEFRQRLLRVFKIMRETHGYDMALLEGYRAPQRQAELAALGPHVTRAGAFESYHQYGLAADCAFVRDGRIVIAETDPWAYRGYELYGQVAQSVGLTWGGSWRSIRDLGHVELARPGVLAGRTTAPLAAAH